LGRPFRPWLYKIATHQAIDSMRRNRRHRQASLDTEHDRGAAGSAGSLMEMVEGSVPDPHAAAEQSERRLLVRASVDGLSEHLRAVVVLSYYQGMKYKEIADILQIPVGTVKSRLHAAIRRLGEQWDELGFSREQ
jgi:RNA polymerase sigma-70 factor (ECF subfamily)